MTQKHNILLTNQAKQPKLNSNDVPCDGIVEVRAHMRGGVPVRAYTRSCGYHPPHSQDQMVSSDFKINRQTAYMTRKLLKPILEQVIELANHGNQLFLDIMRDKMKHVYGCLEEAISLIGRGSIYVRSPGKMSPQEIAEHTEKLIEVSVDDIFMQEGFIPYPYLDTKAKKTIGVGHLVDKNDPDMKLFRMQNGRVGAEITDESEKRACFQRMEDAAKLYTKTIIDPKTGKEDYICTTLPSRQEAMKNLGFGWSETYAREVLKQDIETKIRDIRDHVATLGLEFFDLPLAQQRVLLDCRFNMGSHFTLSLEKRTSKTRSWPKFTRHMLDHSIIGMMNEIQSNDVAERRNLWRQAVLALAQLETWEKTYEFQ